MDQPSACDRVTEQLPTGSSCPRLIGSASISSLGGDVVPQHEILVGDFRLVLQMQARSMLGGARDVEIVGSPGAGSLMGTPAVDAVGVRG